MAEQEVLAGHALPRQHDTAVVIGASIAGLCAARVVADHFERVEVIDRDELPVDVQARRQVPQGRHPHLLLPAGSRLLEAWFPGILADLRRAGAIDLDLCRDFMWHQSGGCLRRPASMLCGPAMSRPLLEHAVRQRVASHANVTVRDRTSVAGLTIDTSQDRINGVQLADGETLPCELVVDATGRQARSLAWLQALGFEPPPVSVVEVDTRYVTRVYRRRELERCDWKAAAVIDHPRAKRLAMLLPMEGDRWILTIAGINGESVPTDSDAMLAYARTFGSPVIADVIATSEPLGDAVTHRFPANQRRHVERLRDFPLGWLLLGDAVCSFDPIYGQGMTVAAQQAEVLGRHLSRTGRLDRAFTRSYFRAASRTVNAPWSIAVGGDFAYPGTTGRRPFGTDLVNRYMDRVVKAGQHDDRIAIRLNETLALLRSPQSLMAPAFAVRVLRSRRRAAVVAPDVPPTPMHASG